MDQQKFIYTKTNKSSSQVVLVVSGTQFIFNMTCSFFDYTMVFSFQQTFAIYSWRIPV